MLYDLLILCIYKNIIFRKLLSIFILFHKCWPAMGNKSFFSMLINELQFYIFDTLYFLFYFQIIELQNYRKKTVSSFLFSFLICFWKSKSGLYSFTFLLYPCSTYSILFLVCVCSCVHLSVTLFQHIYLSNRKWYLSDS